MKSYLVVGADGSRYGPAEPATLVRWVREGRIVAGTILIDPVTNEQLTAVRMPELREALFDAAPSGTLDQTQTAYARPNQAVQAAPTAGIPHVPPIPIAPLAHETPGPKSKVAAGLLGLLLGGVGAHRFYLGYPGIGVLILLSNAACGLGLIWGFIEGILCLLGKMRDADGRLLHD